MYKLEGVSSVANCWKPLCEPISFMYFCIKSSIGTLGEVG